MPAAPGEPSRPACYNRAMPRFTQTRAAIIGIGIVILGSLLLLGIPKANAQKASPPHVPEAIQTHPDEEVVLLAHASGSQIYTCKPDDDGKFIWTLKAPDAELKDQNGKVIGTHFAGPTWKLKDGSEVTGKTVARADSDDPNSIPWLLVHAIGNAGPGLLSDVTSIQRVHTRGGKPPDGGCDQSHHDAETKSSYTADYYFYAPAKEDKKSPTAKPRAQSARSPIFKNTIFKNTIFKNTIFKNTIDKNTIDKNTIYRNTTYGFTFSPPKPWEVYSVVADTWQDNTHNEPNDEDDVVQQGPAFIIKFSQSTSKDSPQDIAIMVFTHAQWNAVEQGDIVVSAAPFAPAEIARNRRYVFAEPPRDLNPSVPGYNEALEIMRSNPLHAFDP
jgi:hypothetical protein